MNRREESEVRSVLRKHIDTAIDEICNSETITGIWWPEGFAERLAEQVTQSIALMQETCVMTEENARISR